MPRIVKEYTERRNDILDVALHLVYSKGYEHMTIQDILDELHISKGAFYHYFDSKPALLEAMIERNLDEAVEILAPILDDPDLSAIEKLDRYFSGAARWKTDHKAYVLSLLRVWYADENAIMRQKVYITSVKRITPMLNVIIGQGVREGVYTSYPNHAGEVILTIMQGLGDNFSRLLLSSEPDSSDLNTVIDSVAAYNDALERVLGTEKGSLQLLEPETLMEWVAISNDTVSA